MEANKNEIKLKNLTENYPGLEARLGCVVAALGADGVNGIRIDQHFRIIVAARHEHHPAHLDCRKFERPGETIRALVCRNKLSSGATDRVQEGFAK